jgi:hypothetical protein
MLTEEGVTNPDPRKIFIDDIINVINEYNKTINSYTILMLDANENVNDSEGGLGRLLQETNLVDAFSAIWHEECNIPTYVRVQKKIDHIFTSDSIVR